MRGKDMEAERGNIQKCSEQIWNWYLASCAGEPRVVGDILGQHHKPEIRGDPRVQKYSQELDRVSMAVKMECEDLPTTPEPAVGHINLLEDFVTGFGLLVEKQMSKNMMCNMALYRPMYNKVPVVVRTECEDAVINLEPNAGHAHLQEDFVTNNGLRDKEDGDVVIKIEDESDEESWIKEDLDIGPTVLQPTAALHPLPPSSQVLRSGTSSGDSAASESLCTACTRPEFHLKVKNYYSRGTSNAGFVLDMRKTDNAHPTVSNEQSNVHPDTQNISMVTEEKSQSRHCDMPAIGYDYKTYASRAIVDIQTGENKQENTLKKSTFTNHICTPMCARRGIKPYKCDQCEYRASRQIDIVVHMRTHTGEKPFKCDHCEFRASHRNTVKNHMRTHTGESPYECGQCRYSGHKLSDLKKHMHSHIGEKLYKCRQCEYRTSDLGQLKIHICSHTGVKLFKCEQCEYRSVLQTNLKRHIRIHTGEKPYKCEHCEYSASEKVTLKIHMKIHMREKLYKCRQCGYKTTKRGHLTRHSQLHRFKVI